MRIKLLLGFILWGAAAHAQQDPQFTQYMFFNLSNNPGYAGTSDSLLNVTTAYRNQWVGLPGNPITYLFLADAPLKALHGGVGLKFMDDEIGNFHFTKLGLSYSYHKRIGANGLLGVGLTTEFVRSDVTNDWLTSSGTVITGPNDISTNFNMGLGAYYRTEKLFIGLSSTNLLQPGYYPSQSFYYFQPSRHYYLTAGCNFYFGSRSKIVPSVLIKNSGGFTAIDVNVTAYWKNFLWTGVSYRYQDAVCPMAGFALPISKGSVIKIGYAYDLGTSSLRLHHDNTHEVFLNYCLKLGKKPL